MPEICSCGAKMKVCQQNLVKGSECNDCGRRIWNNVIDFEEARKEVVAQKEENLKKVILNHADNLLF